MCAKTNTKEESINTACIVVYTVRVVCGKLPSIVKLRKKNYCFVLIYTTVAYCSVFLNSFEKIFKYQIYRFVDSNRLPVEIFVLSLLIRVFFFVIYLFVRSLFVKFLYVHLCVFALQFVILLRCPRSESRRPYWNYLEEAGINVSAWIASRLLACCPSGCLEFSPFCEFFGWIIREEDTKQQGQTKNKKKTVLSVSQLSRLSSDLVVGYPAIHCCLCMFSALHFVLPFCRL